MSNREVVLRSGVARYSFNLTQNSVTRKWGECHKLERGIVMEQKKVGELLGRCREHAGLTQEELARLLFTSRSKVAMVESGERKIQFIEAIEWAETMGQLESFFLELGKELELEAIKRAAENQRIVTQMKTLVGIGA